MYALEYSNKFKKDLKLMVRRGFNVEELRTLLGYLEQDGQVPPSYRPHILSGDYENIWECHIKPDWLLLYDVSDTVKLVRLVRTGTHSDLFK